MKRQKQRRKDLIVQLFLIGFGCILQVCSVVGMELQLDQLNTNLRHEYEVRGVTMTENKQEEHGYFYLSYIFLSVADGPISASKTSSTQTHRYLRGGSSGKTFLEHSISETKVGTTASIHKRSTRQNLDMNIDTSASESAVSTNNAKHEESENRNKDKDQDEGNEDEAMEPEVEPDEMTFTQRIENAVHHTFGTPVELFEATKAFEPDLPKLSSFLKFVGSSLLFIMQ